VSESRFDLASIIFGSGASVAAMRTRYLVWSFISSVLAGCATPVPPEASTPSPTLAPAPSVVAAAKPTSESPPASDPIQSAVTAADRSAEDRALDGGRKPLELMTFAGVAPGQRVAELQAGGGYTAELLARIVGPNGRVYGQNSPFVLQRFAEKPWSERLQKPVMANVTRVDRELWEPLPPDATELDAVFLVMFYHDAVWQKVDRTKMNAAIFRALRRGGVYLVVDHSAKEGTGLADTETLHRIEESALKQEVLSAGFQLAADSNVLKNPSDTRDWSTSPRVVGERRGTSDRFVLKFVKP
jgi:predicted methyltransferase